MSNIFDAVRKNGTIDISDLTPLAEEDLTGPSKPLNGPIHPRNYVPPPATSRIVRLRASAFSPVFPFDDGQREAAEQYRVIRTRLLHSSTQAQVVVVSSASIGDGKTLTSINVAASLALKNDSQVLLVDSDLRRPRIAEELDLPIAPGLSEILSGSADLESALIRSEQFPNLFILTAGGPAASPSELLDSLSWRGFIDAARARFASIILDAPPMATVADYELLQLMADGVVLVVRPDHSNRSACLKALEAVPKQKLLGVVLNCVEDWWLWKTPGHGYYGAYVSDRTS